MNTGIVNELPRLGFAPELASYHQDLRTRPTSGSLAGYRRALPVPTPGKLSRQKDNIRKKENRQSITLFLHRLIELLNRRERLFVLSHHLYH